MLALINNCIFFKSIFIEKNNNQQLFIDVLDIYISISSSSCITELGLTIDSVASSINSTPLVIDHIDLLEQHA